MMISRPSVILAAFVLLCAVSFPMLSQATLDQDTQAMLTIEKAARQKSIALLVVLKSMGPELAEGISLVPMARIVASSCAIRDARDPDSRVILVPNLNDEYPVLDKDDNLVLLDLGERRTGWVTETNLQLFEVEVSEGPLQFNGADPQLIRRYATVVDELLAGLNEDRKQADKLLGNYIGMVDSVLATEYSAAETLQEYHAKVVELQDYAKYFHRKYIVNYDFSMQNKRAFLENLSAWGEVLLGKSTFTTKTLITQGREDVEKVKGTLLQLSLGGNLEVNEKSTVRASFAKKNEVNQTPYSTMAANVGYNHKLNSSTRLDLLVDTYSYADDINTFNDFRRNVVRFKSDFDRPTSDYRLGYTFSNKSFQKNDIDDFASHGLDASARWKRGNGGIIQGKLFGNFQSSDSEIHNFNHIIPSVEYSHRTGTGQVRWRALYELLSYCEANFRSFNRAHISYDKTNQDGPSRNNIRCSATHKNFPDNELSTYVQLKAVWSRSMAGPVKRHFSINTYTNFHLDNPDNNFTDFRLGRALSTGRIFSDLNIYTRLWHKPGETTATTTGKPYILDAFGKFGWETGNVRFGPTLGMHLMVARGTKVWSQDGNLVRLGAAVEGFFSLAHDIKLNLSASYDYGFVYSNEISIDPGGDYTVGDTVQRHPTTLQISAFGSMPVSKNFDLTTKLMVYRIATAMTLQTSITPVTDNDRFTLFVGLRYHHN